jgi:hypothetical protein
MTTEELKQCVCEIELANDCIFQAAKRLGRDTKAFDALKQASAQLLTARTELNDELKK